MIPPTPFTRPVAGPLLTLAALAGLAAGFFWDTFDSAMQAMAKSQGDKTMTNNQELLYGLRKAIETVEACEKSGVQLGTITVSNSEPSFTTLATPALGGGPQLPFDTSRGALVVRRAR